LPQSLFGLWKFSPLFGSLKGAFASFSLPLLRRQTNYLPLRVPPPLPLKLLPPFSSSLPFVFLERCFFNSSLSFDLPPLLFFFALKTSYRVPSGSPFATTTHKPLFVLFRQQHVLAWRWSSRLAAVCEVSSLLPQVTRFCLVEFHVFLFPAGRIL